MQINKKKFVEILQNIGFFMFYISLFIFQMLPSFLLIFLELNSPWFWISIVLCVVAIIVQEKNFGCHNSMFWHTASIGAIIGVTVMKFVL